MTLGQRQKPTTSGCLAYLQRMTDGYTPKPLRWRGDFAAQPFGANGMVFSRGCRMGRNSPARASTCNSSTATIFTMFRDPGSHQMAVHVAAALEKTGPPAG